MMGEGGHREERAVGGWKGDRGQEGKRGEKIFRRPEEHSVINAFFPSCCFVLIFSPVLKSVYLSE